MLNIKEGENIISVYRRHVFVFLLELFPLVFFAIVTVAIAFFVVFMFFSMFFEITILALFVMTLFLHLLWIAIFITLVDYYLDVWILTDERVISIEQKSLFSRVTYEFELSRIQEIEVDVKGVLPTLIDYGDVRVRTASENPDFIFKQVRNPNKIKGAIMRAKEKQALKTSQ